jgi:hypothetical protein
VKTHPIARLFSPLGVAGSTLSFLLLPAALLALSVTATPAHAFQIQIQPPFKIKKKPKPAPKDKPPPDTIQKYEAMIDPEAIRGHVKFLASSLPATPEPIFRTSTL